MKKRALEISIGLLSVPLVFILHGIYLYFSESLSISQVLKQVGREFGNFIAVAIFGFSVAFIAIFIYSQILKKTRSR